MKDKRNSSSWDDRFTPVRCPKCDCIVEGFDDGTVLQHYDENGDYCMYDGKGETVEDNDQNNTEGDD